MKIHKQAIITDLVGSILEAIAGEALRSIIAKSPSNERL